MKRLFAVSMFMMLSAIAVYSSETGHEYKYYKNGVYVSLDFAPGLALNERTRSRESNTSVGTDVALGYRFMPQLAIAIGTGAHGYSNRTWTCGDTVPRKVENTCVPVFVRLRCDLYDREVTPFLQMDLGYSFMEKYARDDMGRVHYGEERFTNGRYEYIEMNDSHIQYGMDGCFVCLDLGISLHIIGRSRMNLSFCTGLHQSFLGTSFWTADGTVLDFGRIDYLIDSQDQKPVLVRTVGNPEFRDTLEPFLRVRISFTF